MGLSTGLGLRYLTALVGLTFFLNKIKVEDLHVLETFLCEVNKYLGSIVCVVKIQ